jgi:hypothetical protein
MLFRKCKHFEIKKLLDRSRWSNGRKRWALISNERNLSPQGALDQIKTRKERLFESKLASFKKDASGRAVKSHRISRFSIRLY